MATQVKGQGNTAATTKGDTKSTVIAKGGAKPTNAKTAMQPQVKPGRFFLAMVILLVALNVVQIGLAYINSITHKGLEKPILVSIGSFQVTPLIALYIGIVIVIYWAMIRFNILPRATPRTAAAPSAKGSVSGKNGGSQKVAATSAKNAANSKGTPAVDDVEKVKVKGTDITGENDDLYQQVMQQRASARKKHKH